MKPPLIQPRTAMLWHFKWSQSHSRQGSQASGQLILHSSQPQSPPLVQPPSVHVSQAPATPGVPIACPSICPCICPFIGAGAAPSAGAGGGAGASLGDGAGS